MYAAVAGRVQSPAPEPVRYRPDPTPAPQPTFLDLPALKPLAFSGLTRFWHPRCIHVQRCAMLGDAVQRFQTFAKHLAPGVRLKGEGSSGWRAQPEKPEARQEG